METTTIPSSSNQEPDNSSLQEKAEAGLMKHWEKLDPQDETTAKRLYRYFSGDIFRLNGKNRGCKLDFIT